MKMERRYFVIIAIVGHFGLPHSAPASALALCGETSKEVDALDPARRPALSRLVTGTQSDSRPVAGSVFVVSRARHTNAVSNTILRPALRYVRLMNST